MVRAICDNCNKVYSGKNKDIIKSKKHFCSKLCYSEWSRLHPEYFTGKKKETIYEDTVR